MSSQKALFDAIRSLLKNPFCEQLLHRINKGKNSRSILSRLTPNYYQYTSPTIRRVQRDGIDVEVDISEYIGWYYYFEFEELQHDALLHRLNENDITMDIGANIGLLTLQVAKRTPTGRIYAFEPMPDTFSQLMKNIDQPGLKCNIEGFNFGFSDHHGSVDMSSPNPLNKGMNRVLKDKPGNLILKTLDSFVDENNLERIDNIKIDVEGYEIKVLLGAQKTILSHMPFLLIELDDKNLRHYGSSAQTLIILLEDWGYSVRNAEDHSLIYPSQDFSDCHYDIYAIPHNEI